MDKKIKENLIKIGIDVDKALKLYFLDDEDFFIKVILDNFLKQDLYMETYKKVQENDLDQAFMYAHKLKSQIGYLCFTRLYDNICIVCDRLRNKKSDDVLSLLEDIEIPYYKFISLLKEYH